MQRKIAWEKFSPKREGITDTAEVNENIEDDEVESGWQDEEEIEETNEDGIAQVFNSMDAILIRNKIRTPFGYYEIEDDFSPYNMFDCWIGHTNFRITNDDFNTLNKKIEGIGCLKVLSPYRFFIGIEKMFTFPAIRIQIQKDLCNNLDFDNNLISYSKNADEMIDMAISKINDAIFSIKDSEKWAIYIGNDGTIETIKNSDFEYEYEYNDKLKVLKSLKSGNIITYDSL